MSEKIKLNNTLKVKRQRFSKKKRILLIGLFMFMAAAIVIAVTGVYVVVIPAQRVYASVQNILSSADELQADIEQKDLSKLDSYVTSINAELASINSELDRYEFLDDFSVTKGYYDNLQVVRDISLKSGDLLNDSLPDLKILLESLGYKVEAGTDLDVEPSEDGQEEDEDQVSALIREMPQVLGLYDDIEPEILELIELFNQIDPQYIPAIGSGGIREKVAEIQGLALDFPALSAQVKNTLRRLPDLLGSSGPVTYLLLLQNEKELRASGGLLTSYGILKVDGGEIIGDINIVDMWDLEGYISWTLGIDTGKRNIYGQNFLMNNGCGSSYLRAQDSGIYPDLYWTMETFTDYYDIANQYNSKKYPAYDHVLMINTFFASDLVSLIEPIELEDYPGKIIDSDNVAKEIFAETSTATFDPATRKAFIGELATIAKQELIDKSASDFPNIFQILIGSFQAKNIALYSEDEDMQAYFDELGISGRIEKNFAGDYFNLSEAQNCSLKSNFYVKDTVTQDIRINDNGRVFKNVTINWSNRKIYDAEEERIYSKDPRFAYRAWVRIFAPQGTDFTETDGLSRSGYLGYYPVDYFDEVMQKEASDNVIRFDHRRFSQEDTVKTQELNVSYTLPKSIKYDDSNGYRMLIQKHPGKENEKYIINITQGGNTTSTELRLDRDKVVTYRAGVITVENYDTRLDQYVDLLEQLKDL